MPIVDGWRGRSEVEKLGFGRNASRRGWVCSTANDDWRFPGDHRLEGAEFDFVWLAFDPLTRL